MPSQSESATPLGPRNTPVGRLGLAEQVAPVDKAALAEGHLEVSQLGDRQAAGQEEGVRIVGIHVRGRLTVQVQRLQGHFDVFLLRLLGVLQAGGRARAARGTVSKTGSG